MHSKEISATPSTIIKLIIYGLVPITMTKPDTQGSALLVPMSTATTIYINHHHPPVLLPIIQIQTPNACIANWYTPPIVNSGAP